MEAKTAVTALAALAQESRLTVFRLLVQAGSSGMAAGKIGEAAGIPPSSLSFHLKELAHAGMVTSRQEGRFVIYEANFSQAAALVAFLSDNCCGGQACDLTCAPGAGQAVERVFNVLILCTGNSARSIMAEALINTMGQGRFRAWSAGSRPTGKVNPLAIDKLRAIGYPTDGLRSKSWDEFAVPGAPQMDFVITVCDNAAGEVCPLWPGQSVSAHWGFEDPAAAEGSDEDKRRAFDKVFRLMMNRVRLFVNLPLGTLDAAALRRELDHIGQSSQ
jgi:arsenate reductase